MTAIVILAFSTGIFIGVVAGVLIGAIVRIGALIDGGER